MALGIPSLPELRARVGRMAMLRGGRRNPVVSGVSVEPATASVAVAGTTQLTANLEPPGSAGSVAWSSGTPAVATVSQSGLVTGVMPGTSVVTATVSGYSDTCTVTVTL